MLKVITAIAALMVTSSALAQSDLTVSDLAKNEATRTAFNQMVKGHKLPGWVSKGERPHRPKPLFWVMSPGRF